MGMYKRMNHKQRKYFRQSLMLLVVVCTLTIIMAYQGGK